LDKTVAGKITFASNIQNYSDLTELDLSINVAGEKKTSVGIAGTQIRHLKINNSGNPIPWTMDRDLTLYLDDSLNIWKKGQSVKIICDSQIIPGPYSISIKTDSQNITNSLTPYSVLIAKLTASDFATTYGRTGKPIIEIVCKDPKTLTFFVDKIIR